MIWEMCCISDATIWKLHVNTNVNDVLKQDYIKSVPVWMLKGNNVMYWATQYFMWCTDMLVRLWHGNNDSTTGLCWILWNHKEFFNLPIACASFFLVSNSEAVSSWNSLVHSGMEHCISILHSLKKCDIRNGFYSKKQQKVILKWQVRFAFPQGTNRIELVFEMCSVGSEKAETIIIIVVWFVSNGFLNEDVYILTKMLLSWARLSTCTCVLTKPWRMKKGKP